MKPILNYLFPEYSKWIDVGVKDIEGNYSLIQYHYRIRDNKKSFRTSKIGFINGCISTTAILNRVNP